MLDNDGFNETSDATRDERTPLAHALELEQLSSQWRDSYDMNRFARVCSLLYSDILTVLDRKIWEGEVVGKHGPGATADRLTGNGKWHLSEWTQRLESILPYGEQLLPNWGYYHQLDHVTIRDPKDEVPVRVITVPKTLKTPRIIAIEPTCMQYAQQALLSPLVELLEADHLRPEGFGENLVSGMVGFTDQNPNRELARLGSLNSQLATLDLSEASDRVSLMHVSALLDSEKWPHLHEAAFASRSRLAEVPGWGLIAPAKFASMGSALCFPMEAMVFLATVFLGIEDSLQRPITRRDILSFRDRVRVYGDDIIVPIDHVNHVMSALDRNGFKVNHDKSFWNGKFRESCGGDYFDGQWVTPARLRKDLPQSMADASETASLVSFRNQLYQLGYWNTVKVLDGALHRFLKSHFPTIETTSPLLGRHTVLDVAKSLEEDPTGSKVSQTLHAPVVRGYELSAVTPASRAEDHAALRKCLSPQRVEPFEDEKHLERQGRPEIVRIKLRWRPPF